MGRLHSAITSIRVLKEIASPGTILLRGLDSILRGEPQNDLDLWAPHFEHELVIESARMLGKVFIEQELPHQKKFVLEVRDTSESVEVDLFSKIVWRGLEIVDVSRLTKRPRDDFLILTFPPNIEAWIVVMKNALHGSLTPPNKIDFQTINQLQSLKPYPKRGTVADWFFRQFEVLACKQAFDNEIDQAALLKLRLLFVVSKLLEQPFRSIIGILEWGNAKFRNRLR